MRADIKAYYSIPFQEYHMPVHRHERSEIMYALSGSCKVWADGHDFILRPGWFVFLQKNIPHRLVVTEGAPCHILNLEFTLAQDGDGWDVSEFFQQEPDSLTVFDNRCLMVQDSSHLCHSLQDLIRELGSPAPDPFAIRLLTLRLLLELVRCLRRRELPAGYLYVKKAARYLEQHMEDGVTTEDVASAAGIHPSYLQILFKKQYGCTMVDYLNGCRLQKAQFLLKNTDMDIIDVAVACGFHSRQHFSYTFKRRCGISPGAFRKSNGGEPAIVTGGFMRFSPQDPPS